MAVLPDVPATACGSSQVIPYAVLIGGSEEYGYQCLACAVMWQVLT